jgi:23S rRNA (guanosine2251-2'-O)-methyltransferase
VKGIVVFGRRPVEEVLDVARDHIRRMVVDRVDRTAQLDTAGLQVVVDAELLDNLCRGNHQGVAAELNAFQYAPFDDLLQLERGCVVVLDSVQDPHNLGAILRTAAVLGVDGVVIAKDRAADVTGTVVRTSAGLAYRVPIARVTNVARSLEQLAEAGFWSVGTDGGGDSAIWDVDLAAKTALVIGAEGTGLRRLVAKKCDFLAKIPMAVEGSSLNASVAAGMAIYEWRRQILTNQG